MTQGGAPPMTFTITVAGEVVSAKRRDTAFWLLPDWSGGDNLNDGAEPFWMRPPIRTSATFCQRHGNWIAQDGCPSCKLKD